jgi:hypothetical protein
MEPVAERKPIQFVQIASQIFGLHAAGKPLDSSHF